MSVRDQKKVDFDHSPRGMKFAIKKDEQIETIKEKSSKERKRGSLYHSSMEWAGIETQEDWRNLLKLAKKEYESGDFFLRWIGRGRELEPLLVATLLIIREEWKKEYDVKTKPEELILDCALISYFHIIRTNYLLGNLEADLEYGYFAMDSPSVKLKNKAKQTGFIFEKEQFNGYSAEDRIQKIIEITQPLLDQYNRMLNRNIKALRDLKRGNILLNIGQVNIGGKQINVERGVGSNSRDTV